MTEGQLVEREVPPNEPRVLVLWADEKSPNLGVRVLGAGAASIARAIWGHGTTVNLQDFAGTQTGVGMGIKAIVKEYLGRKRAIRDFLKSHDYVFDTGAGDSFTDIYGMKRLITIFIIQRWCLAQGIPVILLPQTIGPFNTRVGRILARSQLSKLSLVMARDPKSAAISADLGRKPEVISSDMVFALPTEASCGSYDILLNVSGLLWNSNKHVDSERYRQSVSGFIDLMRSRGRSVTLLAHVVDGAPNDNDSAAIKELIRESYPSVDYVSPASLQQARKVIAAANLVVGARMHACLNALSLGVPTIPWAYSRKFEPLLAQLGWTHLVDLKSSEDVALATLEILERTSKEDLRRQAIAVSEAGRAALALTADGIRTFKA
ncbi:polysaccharide pyruvyl transferase family protein [Pseudarthrobacter oxydans]|uniref:polysaccharide pyruvyl transferase family protein n=1 Tax=Pseudarthrobacter oxydans TaxID=1671 RepID=UPI00382134BF